jgi:DNA invertase Pin-like site-specific DNA recombinase
MARKRTTRPQTGRMIGYVRVSTDRQELSPEHQRAQLTEHARQRGLELELVEDNGRSGGSMDKREGLQYALARLAGGQADALVVTKLDRLARSMRDFLDITDLAREQGWALVILELDLDTSKTMGKFILQVMAAIGELERDMIRDRTRDALAAKRERGEQLGRPAAVPADVVERVKVERDAGSTWQAIADRLNADQVPTGHGAGRWRTSSVQAVYRRAS